jgi:hypothetical protein
MKTLLKALYESEINILIDWMWDSGIQVKIGDRMNGFKEAIIMDANFDEIERWIEAKVKENYPDSKFAKTYNGDDFDSAVEPAIRYLFRNHNPHTKIYVDYEVAELLQAQRTHNLRDEVPD